MAKPVVLRYAPHPGQLAFHHDRYKVRERLMACGTGGGKTYGLLFEVLDWCMENPAGVVLYAMPDVPMFKKAVPKTWELLTGSALGTPDTLGADWNETDRRLRLPNGWVIWFVTVDDPTKIEGPPEVDLVVLDEARVVRKLKGEDGAWLQLTRRLRGGAGRARRRGAIMATHSPSSEILAVFKPRKVSRFRANGPRGTGRFEVTDCEAPEGVTRKAYQWGTLDAAAWGTLSEEDARVIVASLPTDAARKRVAEGRFAKASGLVYDGFDEARHLRPMPPGLKPDLVVGGLDFGWDVWAATATRWTGARKWVSWEARVEKASLKHMASCLEEAERRFGRMKWWGDPSRPDTCAELAALGFDVEPAPSSKVLDGVNLLQADLASDELAVDPACEHVRKDLDGYVRKKDSEEPDKAVYDAHHLDTVRYARIGASAGNRDEGFVLR